jgi:hypothetical protein
MSVCVLALCWSSVSLAPPPVYVARSFESFKNSCKAVEKKFPGILSLAAERTDWPDIYRCRVMAADWGRLEREFGLSPFDGTYQVTKDSREDWQIGPGLAMRFEMGDTLIRDDKSEDKLFPGMETVAVQDDSKNPLVGFVARGIGQVAKLAGVVTLVEEVTQKGAKVDDARKHEYFAAKTHGMDSVEYAKAKEERVAQEDSCKWCYNSKFEMHDGKGWHMAGVGVGQHDDEHEPATYDFCIRHMGIGPSYVSY